MQPELIKGGIAADDRGELSFINDFSFEDIKRSYLVKNHARGFIRAWHAHKLEAKFVTVVTGSALVCCVEIDDWQAPSSSLPVHRFVLSAATPSILHIPAGYANGFMSLSDDARLMFYSNRSLQESLGDDIRYPSRLWDPWGIEER